MVSYLTTVFLGRPPGGSLPVLSAHSPVTDQYKMAEFARKASTFNFESNQDVDMKFNPR